MKVKSTQYFDNYKRTNATISSNSWKEIPHVSFMYEPDVTEICAVLEKINEDRKPERKITFDTVIVKIIAEGLKAAPIMNAHIDYKHRFVDGKIKLMKNINISVPIPIDDGKSINVTLKKVNTKSLDKLIDDVLDIKRKIANTNIDQFLFDSYASTVNTVKKRKSAKFVTHFMSKLINKSESDSLLKGQDLKDYRKIPKTERMLGNQIESATTSVTSTSSLYLGQRGSTALMAITPPQVTTFSIGGVTEKPGVLTNEDGSKSVAVRKIVPICIAFDHRGLDFGETVPFMKRTDEIFENPEIINSWLGYEDELASSIAQ